MSLKVWIMSPDASGFFFFFREKIHYGLRVIKDFQGWIVAGVQPPINHSDAYSYAVYEDIISYV